MFWCGLYTLYLPEQSDINGNSFYSVIQFWIFFRALNTSGTSVMLSDVDVMKRNRDDLPVSGRFNFGWKYRRQKRNQGLCRKLWWKLPVAKEATGSWFSSSRLPPEVHLRMSSSYTSVSPQDPLLQVCRVHIQFTREVLLFLCEYLALRMGRVLPVGVLKLLLKVIKCWYQRLCPSYGCKDIKYFCQLQRGWFTELGAMNITCICRGWDLTLKCLFNCWFFFSKMWREIQLLGNAARVSFLLAGFRC